MHLNYLDVTVHTTMHTYANFAMSAHLGFS